MFLEELQLQRVKTISDFAVYTVYLWVSYDSQNKQRLFPGTALTN
jgi:hypothetical protein